MAHRRADTLRSGLRGGMGDPGRPVSPIRTTPDRPPHASSARCGEDTDLLNRPYDATVFLFHVEQTVRMTRSMVAAMVWLDRFRRTFCFTWNDDSTWGS